MIVVPAKKSAPEGSRLQRWLCGAVLCLWVSPGITAEPIKIAVAANFAPTLSILAEQYMQQTQSGITIVSGSTGKLYAQILHGAPFDMFFAADTLHPVRLETEGLIMPGSRVTYAMGQLVLWQPDGEAPDLDDLGRSDGRVAIANPRLAPYGQAAREVLQSRGLWAQVKGRIVMGESVAQTYQFAHTRSVRWALLPLALLLRDEAIPGKQMVLIDTSMHKPIEQQAVILKTDRAEASMAFMAFLRGEAAGDVIQSSGYHLPGTEHAH